MEPQLDTSTTAARAPASRSAAMATASVTGTGWPATVAWVARGRSKIPARSRALLHTQGPFTSGVSRGVTRSSRWLSAGSSAVSFQSALRCQRSTVHPRAHPGHTDGVASVYHTRALARSLRASSAPTGQMSTTLSEYASAPKSAPSAGRMSAWSPRCTAASAPDCDTSCVNRTHRVHMMHRSLSSRMRSVSG